MRYLGDPLFQVDILFERGRESLILDFEMTFFK